MKKSSYAQNIKAMVKVMGGKDIFPEVKMPVKRKKRAKGMKYNRVEDQLRPLIIKALKKRGFKVWRIENSLRGNKGIPDLLAFKIGYMCWIEVKTPTGRIQPEQLEFADLCFGAGVNHFFIRSVEDLNKII